MVEISIACMTRMIAAMKTTKRLAFICKSCRCDGTLGLNSRIHLSAMVLSVPVCLALNRLSSCYKIDLLSVAPLRSSLAGRELLTRQTLQFLVGSMALKMP